MGQRIVIDPVTRIEGHAKITLQLGEDERVRDARFHVTELRGFEKICEGRPLFEMPGITSRVCGICPVSHMLASSKAGDQILSVKVPPAALELRRLINLAQIVQSHALSFFHLSGPDLLLGMESDPARRNLFGMIASEPEFARRGIRLRQLGQEIIEKLGGRKVHPSWSVPGGVRSGLTPEARAELRGRVPEAIESAVFALDRFKRLLDGFETEVLSFGSIPTLFLALVGHDGTWEHHEGALRLVDAEGRVVEEDLDPLVFEEVLAEAVEQDSYMKSAYYRPLGYPHGAYRVGPLARLNVCVKIGTPLADRELVEYRGRFAPPASSSFLYHYARLIEILGALEHIDRLLADGDLSSPRIRANAGINQLRAVGVSEAPRGTLFHGYEVTEDGLMKRVNLLIATSQNTLAINRTLLQIAHQYVRGPSIPEGVLNRLEAGVRAFDPCLSCATHAFGKMPLDVQLLRPDGSLADRKLR